MQVFQNIFQKPIFCIIVIICYVLVFFYTSEEKTDKLSASTATNSWRTVIAHSFFFVLLFLETITIHKELYIFTDDLSLDSVFLICAVLPVVLLIQISITAFIVYAIHDSLPLTDSSRNVAVLSLSISGVILLFFTDFSVVDILTSTLFTCLIAYTHCIYQNYKTAIFIIEHNFENNSKAINKKYEEQKSKFLKNQRAFEDELYSTYTPPTDYSARQKELSRRVTVLNKIEKKLNAQSNEELNELEKKKHFDCHSTFDKYYCNIFFKLSFHIVNMSERTYNLIRTIFLIYCFTMLALASVIHYFFT